MIDLSSKSKKKKMECRKHNHQGHRGVCPSCLRDKLSLLPNTTPYYYTITRSNSSSTTVSSSPSSPLAAVKDHHRRAGSMTMSYAVREALSGNLIEALGGGLKKSRSVAYAPRDSFRDSKNKKTTAKKKKTGFWTKLLHLKGKGGGADVGGLVGARQRVY